MRKNRRCKKPTKLLDRRQRHRGIHPIAVIKTADGIENNEHREDRPKPPVYGRLVLPESKQMIPPDQKPGNSKKAKRIRRRQRQDTKTPRSRQKIRNLQILSLHSRSQMDNLLLLFNYTIFAAVQTIYAISSFLSEIFFSNHPHSLRRQIFCRQKGIIRSFMSPNIRCLVIQPSA